MFTPTTKNAVNSAWRATSQMFSKFGHMFRE